LLLNPDSITWKHKVKKYEAKSKWFLLYKYI
jgi:hypothetical protein